MGRWRSFAGGDQAAITAPPAVNAAPPTRVPPDAVAGTAFTLAAAKSTRNGAIVFNDTTGALSIRYGAGASTTNFTVRIAAGGYWEMPAPIYSGVLSASCTVTTGGVQVTEM